MHIGFAVVDVKANAMYYNSGDTETGINKPIAKTRARELVSFVNSQSVVVFTASVDYVLLWANFLSHVQNNCGYGVSILSSGCIHGLSQYLLQYDSIQNNTLKILLQNCINNQKDKFQSIECL